MEINKETIFSCYALLVSQEPHLSHQEISWALSVGGWVKAAQGEFPNIGKTDIWVRPGVDSKDPYVSCVHIEDMGSLLKFFQVIDRCLAGKIPLPEMENDIIYPILMVNTEVNPKVHKALVIAFQKRGWNHKGLRQKANGKVDVWEYPGGNKDNQVEFYIETKEDFDDMVSLLARVKEIRGLL